MRSTFKVQFYVNASKEKKADIQTHMKLNVGFVKF